MTSSSQSSKSKVLQVSPIIRPTHDPEKQEACANLSGDLVLHDQIRSKSPDLLCVLVYDKLQDPICFGQARSPLINKWKMVGTVFS